eukprot:Pompholyxophrys_punicea_v1_NODE_557_length_1654_cov_6.640195.p1 type:complete len:230 gc:universal NODE_557_length_1654_cov_6.640195:366-1055(+)
MAKFEERTYHYLPNGTHVDEYVGVDFRSSFPNGGVLKPGMADRPLIVYYHDECIFWVNDRQTTFWGLEVSSLFIHYLNVLKSSAGRTWYRNQRLMVSDFICEEIGYLRVSEAERIKYNLKSASARVIFEYGKNREGYWGNAHLREQMKNTIALHNVVFPNAQALFVFDNSSGHLAYAPDALVAERMNVNPGGQQPKMRATMWKGMPQEIGQKGLRQVIFEIFCLVLHIL